MNEPVGAREALLIEAIGEMVNLIDSVDRLTLSFERQVKRSTARAKACDLHWLHSRPR